MLKEGTKVIEVLTGIQGVVVDTMPDDKYHTGILWADEDDSVFWYTDEMLNQSVKVLN